MAQESKGSFEPISDDELRIAKPKKAPPCAYELFMYEQNIPIYRSHGVYDIRQLPLAPWERMGGQGTFLQLDGQANVFGMYVVEVPAGGVLTAERHIYEETFIIFEGRGSTEVWREGSSKKLAFEWQPVSKFIVPPNVWHRLVNATSSPALALVKTNAPRWMELCPNKSFIFDNPYEFREQFDESEDFYKPSEEIEYGEDGKASRAKTNFRPDISHSEMPLDNMRAPGMRRGDGMEYPSGRYSNAHAHMASRVLVCVRGKGYSLAWPMELGMRPWEAGKGHLVKRQEYIAGGMATAVPGHGDWFHQHFSIGKEPLRVVVFGLWLELPTQEGDSGRGLARGTGRVIGEGGHTLPYYEEDPQVRKDYQEALKKEGVEFTMPEWVYNRANYQEKFRQL
ncbi:MAG: cupin domain-containing protein [Dehalococcoidales bacterium]|nr:cupin domain-containing protein [Dehalococcoidales bacterium]